MFQQAVNKAYDLSDATWEIIIMLLGAFILGYLLKYILCNNSNSGTKASAKEDAGKFAKYANDDLKVVEGIGPKIEELLKENGIKSWKELSESSPSELKDVLRKGGDRFQMHEPSTWADQAALASSGKWKELDEYQDLLIGGRG